MQRKVFGLSLAIVLCLTASAQAIPTVVVGNHVLQPNMAGQQIQLSVTGIVPGTVNGFVGAFQIGSGGTAYPGGVDGPSITGIDYAAGPSIWVVPNTPAGFIPGTPFGDGNDTQFLTGDLVTTSGFVNVTNGIFVTLTIDTTGFFGGVWDFDMLGNQVDDAIALWIGNSAFLLDIPQSITDGTITIVPEPSSVVLGLFAVAGLGAVAIRKRRARRA
jgi:hypothetical protein